VTPPRVQTTGVFPQVNAAAATTATTAAKHARRRDVGPRYDTADNFAVNMLGSVANCTSPMGFLSRKDRAPTPGGPVQTPGLRVRRRSPGRQVAGTNGTPGEPLKHTTY
jgi:hypothetical protein